MTAGRKHALIAAGLALMAVTAWLSNRALFRQDIKSETAFTRTLPTRLGPWMLLEDVPPTESEYRGLETRDIVKWQYSDGRDVIELVVAYIARSNRKSAHAQEACLRGAGATVGQFYRLRIPETPVNATAISIDLGSRNSWIYYWYKIGDLHTSEYLRSNLIMFLRGLKGGSNQGTSLVRLLTPSRKGEPPQAAHDRLQAFTRLLLPELQAKVP